MQRLSLFSCFSGFRLDVVDADLLSRWDGQADSLPDQFEDWLHISLTLQQLWFCDRAVELHPSAASAANGMSDKPHGFSGGQAARFAFRGWTPLCFTSATASVKTNCCFAFALARTMCGCCLGELERFVCLLTCVSVNPCRRNTDAQATATACCQSINLFTLPPLPWVLLQTFSLAFQSLFGDSGFGLRAHACLLSPN